MRLSQEEIQSILETFRAHFLPEDHLWLFGSRANPHKKGGDIDLYIETHYQDINKVSDSHIQFILDLEDKIGEQKIDVVIKFKDYHLPIHDIAKREGVQLI